MYTDECINLITQIAAKAARATEYANDSERYRKYWLEESTRLRESHEAGDKQSLQIIELQKTVTILRNQLLSAAINPNA